ncbi:MAG TPA: cupin domain-containing protein [Bacteroidales bacterium]|nr:cupin domain-containing protein [Bacteroidales bacterium]
MTKIIIKKLTQQELGTRRIPSWPVWEKEISRFPWFYDNDEECYIIEGDFIVEVDKEQYHIQKGDFVFFPAGLKCIWDIKAPVRKHYNFP